MATKTEPVSYTIKTISFMKRRVPIMMQNQNGPCPLLALANILLLRNQINLSPDASSVTQDRLIGLVAGYLLDSNNSERLACMDEAHRVNTQRNIEDAIQQLPKLATGVDVNVGFTSIDAFEFTQETVIFDLLDVRLLHGWLVDPQEEELAALLADRSYNELVSVLVDRLGDEAALQPKLSSDAYSQATRIAVEPKEARALQSPSEPTIVSSQGLTEEHAARLASDNAVIGLADTGSPSKTGKPSREQPATEASQIAALSAGVQDTELGDEGLRDLERAIALSLEDNGAVASSEQSAGDISTPSNSQGRKEDSEASPSHGPDSPVGGSEPGLAQPHASRTQDGQGTREKWPAREGEEALEVCEARNLPGPPEAALSEADNKMGSLSLEEAGPSSSGGAGPSHSEEPCCSSSQLGKSSGPQKASSSSEVQYDADALAKGKMPARCIASPGNDPLKEAEWVQTPEDELHALHTHGEDQKSEKRAEELQQALTMQAFFNRTSSQLTEHGLLKLHEGLRPNELGILFRNNHFNVIFAFKDAIWVLATDQGYLFEEIVWEKLSDVHGNNDFARANFTCLNEKLAVDSAGVLPGADADLALALQMQEEENERQARFLAEQQSEHPSYSQMAAKYPKEAASPSKNAVPPKGNAPLRSGSAAKGKSSSEKASWKFWKW